MNRETSQTHCRECVRIGFQGVGIVLRNCAYLIVLPRTSSYFVRRVNASMLGEPRAQVRHPEVSVIVLWFVCFVLALSQQHSAPSRQIFTRALR